MQEAREKKLYVATDQNGKSPFWEWLDNLKDTRTKKRLVLRVRRLATGNYGDCKPVGEGVLELRMTFAPGYRIYFAEQGDQIVILLCGGDKSTQVKDIEIAKTLWKECDHEQQTYTL